MPFRDKKDEKNESMLKNGIGYPIQFWNMISGGGVLIRSGGGGGWKKSKN